MSYRLTSPQFRIEQWNLNGNADGLIRGNDGTWTGESYSTTPWGSQAADFDGTDDKIAVGDVYNGIKSVSFFVNPDTTTEQFMELASGIDVDVTAGTIGTTGWTSPTVYVDGALSSALIADYWQHVVVASATGINANAVNFGVETTNFGDCSLALIKFYACELSLDEAIKLGHMGRRGL